MDGKQFVLMFVVAALFLQKGTCQDTCSASCSNAASSQNIEAFFDIFDTGVTQCNGILGNALVKLVLGGFNIIGGDVVSIILPLLGECVGIKGFFQAGVASDCVLCNSRALATNYNFQQETGYQLVSFLVNLYMDQCCTADGSTATTCGSNCNPTTRNCAINVSFHLAAGPVITNIQIPNNCTSTSSGSF